MRLQSLQSKQNLAVNPFKQYVASVSVGIYQGDPILDFDYPEDSNAETDMNVVMTEHGGFIEIQGTAEKNTFQPAELDAMLALAKTGIMQLIQIQKSVL